MKNKFCTLILISVLILVLAGCKSTIPELNETDKDAVVQYMADSLLRHDRNYQDALLEEEELRLALEEQWRKEEEARQFAEEQERLEQEKLEASKPDDIEIAEPTATVADMAEASGLENIEFDYLGYELCDSYPEATGDELFFAMTASAGHQLLVVTFNMANVSGEDVTIDMLSNGTGYALRINEGSYVPVFNTLLENDLTMYMQTIPMESGKEVVLITEVAEGSAIDTLTLYVRGTAGNKEIKLQ